jgi:hypothetical protein
MMDDQPIGPGAGSIPAPGPTTMKGPFKSQRMEPDMNCPVCGANAEQIAITIDSQTIACPTCGDYEISNLLLATAHWRRLEPANRGALLSEAKRSARPGSHPVIDTDSLA